MVALIRWLIKAQKKSESLRVVWKDLFIAFQCTWLFFLLLRSPPTSKLAQSSIKLVFRYKREVACWREPGENTIFPFYVKNGGSQSGRKQRCHAVRMARGGIAAGT